MISRKKLTELYFQFLKENDSYNLTSDEQSFLCESLGVEAENSNVFIESIQTSIDKIINDRTQYFIENYVVPTVNKRAKKDVKSYAKYLQEKNNIKIKYAIDKVLKEHEDYYKNSVSSIHSKGVLTDLKNILEKYYIELPKEEVQYAKKLEKNISQLQESLLAYQEQNQVLTESLNEHIKYDIIRQTCPELPETQIRKVYSLTESFDISKAGVDNFKQHVQTIKMRYKDFKNPMNNGVLNRPQNPIADAVENIKLI